MKKIEFGIYSLGDYVSDANTGIKITEQQRLEEIIEAAKLAEKYGLDYFSLGESHQEHFISQSHALILAAIARETKTIRLSSSATIISTSDPVRVYEDFATLDILSNGRAEIVAGRASRIGLFELLGYSLRDYEALYEEKFELLLKLFKDDVINWEGNFRPKLKNQVLYPKPLQKDFPIWRAVGGNKSSAFSAGRQGVPMTLATLAGHINYFKETMDAYRKTFKENHPNKEPRIGLDSLMYVAETDEKAFKFYHKYLDHAFKKANGSGFSRQSYLSALDLRNIILVGSPETIISKLVTQFKLFEHERHYFQIDIGGMPFTEVKRIIETLGTVIIPEVKKRLGIEEWK